MKKYHFSKISVFFIFFLFTILLSSGFGSWYYSGWSSRIPIVIDNRNNNAMLYGFQVGIKLPFYPSMQEDFDDIRFTIDDEVTSIPYWLEEYTPSEYAIVWVKVPVIPALDTTIIYLYYGNPHVVSESNGKLTFEFYDNFNDEDISDWSIINGDWTAENKFLEQMLTANHRKILSSFTFSNASITEAKLNYLSDYHYSGLHIFFSKDSYGNNGYKFGFAGLNRGGSRICKIQNGGVIDLVTDSTINVIDNNYVWIKTKVTYNGIGDYSLFMKVPGNIQVFLETSNTTFEPPFTLGAYVGAHIGIDNLRVRKYTDPEPTYTISGEQGVEEKILSISLPHTLNLIPLSSNLRFPFEFLLELPEDATVSGDLFDCSGRKVSSLIRKQHFRRGHHTLIVGRKNHGFSSGIFFLRLTINEDNGKTYYLKQKLLYLK